MLEPVRPEAVLPGRALCLPTFSHFLIANKTSLSLSPLSLSLSFFIHSLFEPLPLFWSHVTVTELLTP